MTAKQAHVSRRVIFATPFNVIIIGALIFFIVSLHFLSLSPVLHIGNLLHHQCLSLVPPSTYQEIYQAFVCGSELRSREYFELFRTTGLLHLIVVSGSHLLFIQNLMEPLTRKIPRGQILLWLILLLYTGICRFDPPILRVFVQYSLGILSVRYCLGFTHGQKTFYAGLLTLSLFPHYSFSISFQLSWIAAMAIAPLQHVLWQSCMCYFALLPIVAHFNLYHPLAILTNALLTPFFGVLIFPVTIAGLFLPGLDIVSQMLWEIFILVLDGVAGAMPDHPAQPAKLVQNRDFTWCYLLLLQAVYLGRERFVRHS